jgi:hypothetical protein
LKKIYTAILRLEQGVEPRSLQPRKSPNLISTDAVLMIGAMAVQTITNPENIILLRI